jgi:PRTRC genetic system protein B
MALLFTQGQYLLYTREGGELRAKGVTVQTLRSAFVEEPVDSGWLPEGVIRSGLGPSGPFLVKYIPPRRHTLALGALRGTAVRSVNVPLPALVFAGAQTTYYVWALREEAFSPTADLYRAPLPNVYEDGRICFGSNRPPQVSSQSIGEAWRLFIESPFNGDLAANKSARHSRDVRAQLFALDDVNQYPVDDLLAAARHHPNYFYRTPIRTVSDMVDYLLLNKEPGSQENAQ